MNLRDTFTNLKNALVGEKGRDGFSTSASSPDYRWHKLLHDFLAGIPKPLRSQRIQHAQEPTIQEILKSPPQDQVIALKALFHWLIEI